MTGGVGQLDESVYFPITRLVKSENKILFFFLLQMFQNTNEVPGFISGKRGKLTDLKYSETTGDEIETGLMKALGKF